MLPFRIAIVFYQVLLYWRNVTEEIEECLVNYFKVEDKCKGICFFFEIVHKINES